MTAEFELYKAKMQELQVRFPSLKKEKEALAAQLKAIEDKEKAANQHRQHRPRPHRQRSNYRRVPPPRGTHFQGGL